VSASISGVTVVYEEAIFLRGGWGVYTVNNVTCLLKAGIVEPEEMAVARQWLCKHVSMATNSRDATTYTHATLEEMLEAVFSVGSMQRLYKESQLGV
jgi:hypothetical protein